MNIASETQKEVRTSEIGLSAAAPSVIEDCYRTLFEQAPEGILIATEQGNYIDANSAICRLLGYTRDEIVGLHTSDIVAHMEFPQKGRSQPGSDLGWRFRLKDGSLFSGRVTTTITPDGNLFAVVRDATGQTKADELLAESEKRYRDLVENAIDIIYTQDLRGNYISVNSAVERITGYTVEEALAMNLADAIAPEYLEKATKMMAAKLAGQNVTAYDLEIIAKNGHRVAVEINTRVIYENGAPIAIQGIARDITERKKAEDKAIAERNLLNTVIDNLPDRIFVKDLKSRVIMNNVAHRRHLGVTKVEEVLGKTDFDFFPPEIAGSFIADEERIIRTGEPLINREQPAVDRSGNHLWSLTTKVPLRDRDGTITGIVGINRDITEAKHAADALRDSDEKFHQLADNITDAFWIRSPDMSKVHYISPAFEQIWGRTVESMYANPQVWIELIFPEDRERVAAAFAGLTGSRIGLDIEYRIVRPDGEIRWVRVRGFQVRDEADRLIRHVGIVTDISERKTLEAEMERLRMEHTVVLNSLGEGVHWIDAGGQIKYENPAAAKMLGYGIAELIGMPAHSTMHHTRADGTAYPVDECRIYATLQDGVARRVTDEVFWRKDGSSFAVEYVCTPVFDREGRSLGCVVVFADITDRKMAEVLLNESKQRLRLATESARLGIWDWDVVSDTLVWDAQMYGIYGVSEGSFGGAYDAWQRCIHPDDRAEIDAKIAAAIAGPRDFHAEFRIFTPDGEVRHIESHALVRRSDDGAAVRLIGVNCDITGRMDLEDQLRQSQKMEAVGQLAGGIAHDFNNLLTAINGYSALTLRKMNEGDPLRDNIQEIKNAGERAAALTDQLLTFSRKQVLQPAALSLNTAISGLENMLGRIIRESVTVRTVLDPELGNIKADPGQIEQVIMNLAVNARDAMPAGGTLTIETKNVFLDEDYAVQHINIARGSYVRMTVTDNGEGMDERTRQRIFEPFFTTKEQGKGTGLGLSTVHGIVQQAGGHIMVYSEPGHGTTFKIYLPRIDEVVQTPNRTGDADGNFAGTETILLVEDEEIVRNLVGVILADSGYTILVADSGKSALSICESYAGPIHILLTDVIMPGMGGSELRDRVTGLRPEIKVLFMSGYTDDAITHGGVLDSDAAFIEKPFTPDSLSRKIRDVILS